MNNEKATKNKSIVLPWTALADTLPNVCSETTRKSLAFDIISELVTGGIAAVYFWKVDYSVSKLPRTPSEV